MAFPELEPLFAYDVKLQPIPEIIGAVAEGIRINFYVDSGKVKGPQIYGSFLPSGGDWMTVRRDGIGLLDVRSTIDAALGPEGLIFMTYSGLIDFGRSGYEAWLALLRNPDKPAFGNQVVFNARSAPRFYTADPEFDWLNRLQCLGFGQIDVSQKSVHFDVYAAGPSEYRLHLRGPSPIDAGKIFADFTNPDTLKKTVPIIPGTISVFDVDVQAGKAFRIVVTDGGMDYTYTGLFLRVEPNSKLVFSWKSGDILDSTVTLQLLQTLNGTLVSVTQYPFRRKELRDEYRNLWKIRLSDLVDFSSI